MKRASYRDALHVPAEPCSSCPYRRDTPPAVWHRSEYEKLREYDEGHQEIPALATFLCHHSHATERQSVCRGWLSVHNDSIAVRLAVMQGQIPMEAVDAPVKAELYASGNEAADAGEVGMRRPTKAARKVIERVKNEIKTARRRKRWK